MDFTRLAPDDLGAAYDNAGRLAAIKAAASAMDDTTPILLLPVRIETRFAEREVRTGKPPTLQELTDLLRPVAEQLEALAATDFRTALEGTVRQKRAFKRAVEEPLYARVEDTVTAARAALAAAKAGVRDTREGDAGDAAELGAVVQRIEAGVPAAHAAVAGLRSGFRREELLALIDSLGEPSSAVIGTVRSRVVPAAAMLRDLGEHPAASPRVLADSAAAYATARATLGAMGQELAGTPGPAGTAVPGLRAQAAGAIAGARAVAEDAAAMNVLPTAWQEQLASSSAGVAERGRLIAERLERSAAGAGAAGDADRRLAMDLREAMDRLEAAPRAVRVDDPLRRPPAPAATRTVDELRVRIFPDDIAVETLERPLTAQERDAGFDFWRATYAAGTDEQARRGAWRALCLKHGSRRAAWIALRLTPVGRAPALRGSDLVAALQTIDRRVDEIVRAGAFHRRGALQKAVSDSEDAFRDDVDGASPAALERARELVTVIRGKLARFAREAARDDAAAAEPTEEMRARFDLLARSLESARPGPVPEPVFPDVELRSGPWTQAPGSSVLPDRFLVVATRGDRAAHVVAGEPVDPGLKLGLDPDPAHGEAFGLDANGDLVVGSSIAWMTDYGEAVRRGMAVTIPIAAGEAAIGFDRIYVLGHRQTTPEAGAELIEGLLDEHHYGESGLALLPSGSPTNTTERGPAAVSTRDDPDGSYAVERQAALFDANAPVQDASDGLRLATALGVDPGRLAHIAAADGRDIADAVLVTEVLWPATLGHGLEELLGELFSIDTRDRIKAFALANVTGRGMVPGLRVGAQPYGLLPAIAFSRFVPASGAVLPRHEPANEPERAARFGLLFRDTLLQMHADWTRLRDTHVAHAHNGDPGHVQQHLLTMLGQQERAVGYDYRFAVNVARRGALSEDFATGRVALLERFATVFRNWLGAGPGPVRGADGQVTDTFTDAYDALLAARAYELRHVAAPRPLRGPVTGDGLPGLVAATPRSLAAAGRSGDGGRRRSLLYLLVRQALLAEYREAALRILAGESMLPEAARRAAGAADTFLVRSLTADQAITRWSYLFDPLSRLDQHFGVQFPAAAGTLYAYLRAQGDQPMDAYLAGRGDNPLFTGFAGHDRHRPQVDALRQHADRATRLLQMPALRVDALLAEHVDVCSHRLDAWITGLAQQRLTELRADAPRGVFVGAYGWVEDLRRDAGGTAPAASVPDALARDAGPPVRAGAGGGFIHAPSIDHAVTAAILRSGYLSESAAPDAGNRMAVNLSSRRTRVALQLIDGIRAGNDIGALLGYRLERFLHDALAGGQRPLDDLIAPLRRAFPSRVTLDPALAADADTDSARQVVDGFALLQTVQAWVAVNRPEARDGTLFDVLHGENGDYDGYPFGLHDHEFNSLLPSSETAERPRLEATLRAIDALADALDAVGDLVLAESIHQLGKGNHARAAAALASLAEGKAPLRPEIVDTPRRGTLVSHRLLVQFAPADAASARPAGWDHVPLTPRAEAEPSLNRWAGELLGPAARLRLRVVDAAGATVADLGADDLGLQPADLVAIAGPGLEEGLAELSARALDTQRPGDVDDDDPPPPLTVELGRAAAWRAEDISLPEIAPLLEAIGELAAAGRPANAHDYVLSDLAASDGATAPGTDPDELEARVRAALDRLSALGVRLLGLLSDGADDDPALLDGDPHAYVAAHDAVYLTGPAGPAGGATAFLDLPGFWARRADFFTALRAAADLGISAALPPTAYPSRAAVAAELLERAQTAFVEVATRRQRAAASLADAAAATDRTARLTEAARAVFGESFAILPRFVVRGGDLIASAVERDLAAAGELEAWLTGVAAVRRPAAAFAELLVVGAALGAAVPVPRVAQLPGADGEAWFGGRLPDGFAPAGDRLSLVVFGEDKLDLGGGPSVGLLVDRWDELIPDAEHTTGVAFNYDQPDASPPQCLLLAVPAQRRGHWAVEDLLQTLSDTLDLAKNRLVELEHVQRDVYAPLLPAVIGELVPEALAQQGADVSGSRVILDFGVSNREA